MRLDGCGRLPIDKGTGHGDPKERNVNKAKADHIAGLQSYINSKQREIDGLIRDYGHGVRPSWVSTDLALARDTIARMEQAIKEVMKDENYGL